MLEAKETKSKFSVSSPSLSSPFSFSSHCSFRLHFRHCFIVAFTFAIVSSPSSPSTSSHRLVVVFACAIASSLSLCAPSPRRCHCLRHRLVAVIVCAIVSSLSSPSSHRRLHLVAVFAVASSPSSPRRCLRRRLIAVFTSPLSLPSPHRRLHLAAVFAVASSPSSSLPTSLPTPLPHRHVLPLAHNDGAIGSRKKLMGPAALFCLMVYSHGVEQSQWPRRKARAPLGTSPCRCGGGSARTCLRTSPPWSAILQTRCVANRSLAAVFTSPLSSPSPHRRLHLAAVFAVASSPSSPRRCLCRRLSNLRHGKRCGGGNVIPSPVSPDLEGRRSFRQKRSLSNHGLRGLAANGNKTYWLQTY
ncbi:hypothetical protein OUZ56_007139 [Daphnia magna]|uniref:Uncharacterized protein n=1 Tax=Daphnia magna TaxID=35525 RepID=A0ABQ9YXU6_9CRUS|nr:hypothetical protein OUZ56_007139 [Daphnia magna]